MDINIDSYRNSDSQNDEYFIPLKPNHAVALTMNFPQFSEWNPSEIPQRTNDFNYNCPDCIADLFGPIMAPYAVLQQQADDYRRRLEFIAHRRYAIMKSKLVASFEKNFAQNLKRTFHHPFKYDIGSFLTKMVVIGRYIGAISSGWILIIGFGLFCFSIYLIFVDDYYQPMLTFIRTFSKFYRTLLFQGFIGYLIIYSIFLIITALCSLLGTYICSYLLTLFGILNTLMILTITIVFPIILNVYKTTLEKYLEKYMKLSIQDYDNKPSNSITIFWDELQQTRFCCGFGNPIMDYSTSYFRNLTGQNLPASCCENEILCKTNTSILPRYFNNSCLPEIKSFIHLTIHLASIAHVILFVSLLIVLTSISYFFVHIPSARKALDKYNEFIIKSMATIVEQYNKKLVANEKVMLDDQTHHDKQHIQGILPITPTIIRVKNPRIMNYFGF